MNACGQFNLSVKLFREGEHQQKKPLCRGRFSKWVTWCFTPSQPVWLYQGKGKGLSRHSLMCVNSFKTFSPGTPQKNRTTSTLKATTDCCKFRTVMSGWIKMAVFGQWQETRGPAMFGSWPVCLTSVVYSALDWSRRWRCFCMGQNWPTTAPGWIN